MSPLRILSIFTPGRCLLGGLAITAMTLSGCGGQGTASADASTGEHPPEHGEQVESGAHSHDDPDETCFICDPTKREEGRLWCKEHGRYEDRCWLCHPELEDKDRLYCKEHSLYEDECFLCHPELEDDNHSPEEQAEAADGDPSRAQAVGLFCHEHGVAEIECAICQPELAATLEPGGSLKIRFPSAESAEKAGVRTGRPDTSAAPPTIEAFCEAQYNLNTLARVTPLAGGVISAVRHDVGEQVHAGDVLLELHSPEVAAAKSDFLSALVQRDIRRQAFERESRLKEQNIAAEKDFIAAEAEHRTAQLAVAHLRQKLRNLGLLEEEITTIEETEDTSAHLAVRAPFDGTLVERAAVVGESAATGDPLFTIADLSTRWLTLSIPSHNIGQIHVGQTVEATFPELPGQIVKGRITWIDSSIDARSRMVRARAVVKENAARIKNGLFGEARIIAGEARRATVVPRDAVQQHEGDAFVFVRNEPDLFALRRVALGAVSGDNVEVLAGLDSRDAVVMDGSFIVMSEFLKSRLGAGCAEH